MNPPFNIAHRLAVFGSDSVARPSVKPSLSRPQLVSGHFERSQKSKGTPSATPFSSESSAGGAEIAISEETASEEAQD